LDVGTGLLEVGPLAFPHVDDVVPFGAKTGHFLFVFWVFCFDVLHGMVTEVQMLFVMCGVTAGAAVPETTVKFVHSVRLAKKTINGERGPGHVILAAIVHVLKVMVLGGMRMIRVSTCHHVASFQVFVGELIHGLLMKLVIAPS